MTEDRLGGRPGFHTGGMTIIIGLRYNTVNLTWILPFSEQSAWGCIRCQVTVIFLVEGGGINGPQDSYMKQDDQAEYPNPNPKE